MTTRVSTRRRFLGPPASSYRRLVTLLAPRPLHDRADYEQAVAMIGRLVGHDLNADQQDYLEALMVFVERYDDAHAQTQVDTRRVSGLRLLRTLLAEHGLGGADLSRLLGASRTLGAMILRGERNITAEHARTLGKHFNLDPGLFIR